MNIAHDIEQAVAKAIKKLWPDIKVKIDIVTPPSKDFGDYACAVALQLAKLIGAEPLEIARKIKGEIKEIDYVSEITITAPGYVNFELDYHKLAKAVMTVPNLSTGKSLKISIEHTSVNPNKAAHIGHLRNACLGDALARILRGVGHTVEVQNYIDDLGVQVADSVVAFETFGDAPEGYEIDKWLWKIYADINKKYEANPELKARRDEVLQEMEKGESETAKQIVEKIVAAQQKTFSRFGIFYDLLVYEHDIVNNHLWDKLFEELKSKKLIVKPDTGDHAGAWLVEFGESEREDKILVKSNGLLTYTAKDLAYALWKFGKGEKMVGYETRLLPIDQHYNVIDERQSYPQAVIKHVMEKLGYTKEAENYLHVGYGVVKLSDKALKKLGVDSDDKSQSMSGRAGIGVMVDDLVDATIAQQIKARESSHEVAEKIAEGSIRYYMLKSRPEREIIFDFEEALRTDGNTGVYLQYAFARAYSILDKAYPVANLPTYLDGPILLVKEKIELNPHEKALIKNLSEATDGVHRAVENYDPSLLCDYAYELASSFAKFYETCPVMQAESESVKNFRINLVIAYRSVLGIVLDLLGIPGLTKI
ncbi:MAG: arginine--tRNA ligase [Patescibacteria group bacterium]